jgi:peptidoglycan/xylan/chitin deacetylase (PgdA/CDA1 family)
LIKQLIKTALEEAEIYRISKFANRRQALILMYHGVTRDDDCSDWTQIRLSDFEEQMEYVQRHYRVVPLSELLQRIQKRQIEPYSTAITFDDGYRSVYDLAFPVLKRRNLPATVYLTTQFVCGTRQNFRYLWTDYITMLLECSGLSEIDLGEFGLGVHPIGSPGNVHRTRSRISSQLKQTSSLEAERVVLTLEDRFASRIDCRRYALYEPMTWEEAGTMVRDGLVTLGAHTRSHPILSRLEPSRLEHEILGSKKDIEEQLDVHVEDFAFPNGRLIDFNSDALRVVKYGFRSAVTTVGKLNPSGQDLYLLNRIGIGHDLTLRRFKTMLSGLYSVR